MYLLPRHYLAAGSTVKCPDESYSAQLQILAAQKTNHLKGFCSLYVRYLSGKNSSNHHLGVSEFSGAFPWMLFKSQPSVSKTVCLNRRPASEAWFFIQSQGTVVLLRFWFSTFPPPLHKGRLNLWVQLSTHPNLHIRVAPRKPDFLNMVGPFRRLSSARTQEETLHDARAMRVPVESVQRDHDPSPWSKASSLFWKYRQKKLYPYWELIKLGCTLKQ